MYRLFHPQMKSTSITPNRECHPEAIIGTNILLPYLQVKTLQLIWILAALNLRSSYELQRLDYMTGYQDSSPSICYQETCPIEWRGSSCNYHSLVQEVRSIFRENVYTLLWTGYVFILMKFSSLAALEVVKMTTSSAASGENFVKMTTFSFQCYHCITETEKGHQADSTWPMASLHKRLINRVRLIGYQWHCLSIIIWRPSTRLD